MSIADKKDGTTRREFGRLLALTATTPLLASADTAEAHQADPAKSKPDGIAGMTLALTELVRLRHGQHLDVEELAAVQRGIASSLSMGQRLGQFPLKNSDEPAITFTADVY